jgi:hypothetical protein
MNFQQLVDVFATLEHLIRSHYHRFRNRIHLSMY